LDSFILLFMENFDGAISVKRLALELSESQDPMAIFLLSGNWIAILKSELSFITEKIKFFLLSDPFELSFRARIEYTLFVINSALRQVQA
jgi:hypothetical protein